MCVRFIQAEQHALGENYSYAFSDITKLVCFLFISVFLLCLVDHTLKHATADRKMKVTWFLSQGNIDLKLLDIFQFFLPC